MDNPISHFTKTVSINNFKSVKDVVLSDCRRINVLIGRPNVGKSNILEALALFDVPFLANTSARSLKSLVRVENSTDLFYDGSPFNEVEVRVDSGMLALGKGANHILRLRLDIEGNVSNYTFAQPLTLSTRKTPEVYPDVLAYFFPKRFTAESVNIDFLLPPSGANLMETVSRLPQLRSSLAGLFQAYGLKMVFDMGSQQIKAMKDNNETVSYLIPFNSLADSLQRLIFFKAAIESNHNRILCFEEPEAHTFPPYVTSVVNSIIDSADNQFFVTTHSPYVMSALLGSCREDLAVFAVDMDHNATVVKRLSDEQLQAAYDNGMDMFFNLETLLDR